MTNPRDGDPQVTRSRGDRLFYAVYFGSHKVPAAICFLLRAAEAGIRSVVTGTWLGLLTPALIRKLDFWYYTRGFPMYVDKDYNLSGWFPWEQEVINEYFAKLTSVLIAAGAGAGREMLALNRMGIRTDGFEYNSALGRTGNALLSDAGFPPSIYPAPANELLPGPDHYDGVIIGWATYTLIPGKAARVALLRQVRSRCSSGAPILLSFFYRSANTPYYRATAAIANTFRTVMCRPKVEIGDALSVGYAHYFTEQEIAAELTAAGFKPVLFKSAPYAHAVGIAL